MHFELIFVSILKLSYSVDVVIFVDIVNFVDFLHKRFVDFVD